MCCMICKLRSVSMFRWNSILILFFFVPPCKLHSIPFFIGSHPFQMLLYILSKTWYKLWVLKLFALCPQTWWAPTRQLGSGLFVWSFLARVRWICGSLSELRHTAALLRFCVGGFLFTVPCGRSGAPMDDSTTARHRWCQVDTYHEEEMGWLQGGEVAAFVKG